MSNTLDYEPTLFYLEAGQVHSLFLRVFSPALVHFSDGKKKEALRQ